jgi:FdhE protein
MDMALENRTDLIRRLKEKNPHYHNILDFYQKITEAQEALKPELHDYPFDGKSEFMAMQFKEGFPLIDKEHFVIDIPSSVNLFASLCHIGKTANENMRKNIQAIEEALTINALNLKKMLRRHSDESYFDAISGEFDISKPILKFMVRMSIRPSLQANVELLKDRADLKNWLRGYCPICGSLPQLSEIKGEGQRYYVCSFCSFQWPGERLQCPFCENRDQKKLHYFYEENRETHRVDLCDNCNQYIKTVDSRKLGYDTDLILEDIITSHLDFLASEKGYTRPVPNLWGL